MSELVSDKFICTYLLGKANHIFNTVEINFTWKTVITSECLFLQIYYSDRRSDSVISLRLKVE